MAVAHSRDKPATLTGVQALSHPQASYATQHPGTAEQQKHIMEPPFHDAMQCRERLKARQHSVQTQWRLSASNELMHISKPHQKYHKKSNTKPKACNQPQFTCLLGTVTVALESSLFSERAWWRGGFNTSTDCKTCPCRCNWLPILVNPGRRTSNRREQTIELVHSTWLQNGCQLEKASRSAGPYGVVYLNEFSIKVCQFDIRVMEYYFLLDRSCSGATPWPCGTLSDTHHRIHTLTGN